MPKEKFDFVLWGSFGAALLVWALLLVIRVAESYACLHGGDQVACELLKR